MLFLSEKSFQFGNQVLWFYKENYFFESNCNDTNSLLLQPANRFTNKN